MKQIINVKVKPRSEKQEIIKRDNIYEVKLKSSPKNNKANVELIKILKQYFKKDVRIKLGFKSRNKILEVID